MGQGVNRKIRMVAARTLGIGLDRIRMESTNTSRVANTSPTAASSGADLNGHATRLACLQIVERLKQALAADRGCRRGRDRHRARKWWSVPSERAGLSWEQLIAWAYARRIPLSAYAGYATPGHSLRQGQGEGPSVRLPCRRHGRDRGDRRRIARRPPRRFRQDRPRRRPEPRSRRSTSGRSKAASSRGSAG